MEYVVLQADGNTTFFDSINDATNFLKSEVFSGFPQEDISLYRLIPFKLPLILDGYGGHF